MCKAKIKLYLTAYALAFSCILSACGAASSAVNELKKGEIIRARQIYVDKIAGDAETATQFEDEYRAYILELYNELNDNKISSDETERQLNSLSKFEYSSVPNDYRREFDYLIASKESYAEAEDYMKDDEYFDAATAYCKVMDSDTNYSDACEKLESALTLYKESVFAEAEEKLNAGEPEKAYRLVYIGYMDLASCISCEPGSFTESVLNEFSNKTAEYKEKYEQDYAASVLNDVAAAQEAGNYLDAISIAVNAYSSSNTKELLTVVEDSYSVYVNSVLDKAADFFTNSVDYKAAMALITECGDILDDASDVDIESMMSILNRAYEYYDSFTPLQLDSDNTFYTDGSNRFTLGDMSNSYDNLGQKYDYIVYGTTSSLFVENVYSGSAIYYVPDYDCFSGRLVLRNSSKDEEDCGSFSFLADGNVIYQSPYISKGFMPIDLSFDISEAETITIYFSYNKWSSFGIADMMVYKDPANYPAFTERL